MRICGVPVRPLCRSVLTTALSTLVTTAPLLAQDKPTGAPLVLSNIETEQPIPLAFVDADGRTAKCAPVRLHWISKPDLGPNEDSTSFTLDLPADNPATPIFTAQLWNASLASALAWQQPWEGARWKVLDTPVTDGTGLDAALAVGMIATAARRPYPPKTVVIGTLNPDGSLGPVSHIVDRIDAAARAGLTRAIIPSVQRFDTNPATGEVTNIVRHASDLGIEAVPVDDLISATQTTMNDPLPDATLDSALPKYSNDVATYIDDFAHREQVEVTSGLRFAPKKGELASYPAFQGAIWNSVFADYDSAQEAYGAGQVYVAYQLFARANGRMNGANALAGQTRAGFDVKTALSEADDLHNRLHEVMTPPSIDEGTLQSAVLVAEMADWAYDVNAALEGAQLLTKQAFSQRSDATEAERDRSRESILFANAQCRYLLTQVEFYTGLASRVEKGAPVSVDVNATHLLPQLIPAQLAMARSFVEGIRASDLRDSLLFDPRLVAYVNVLRQEKSDWDAHLRKRQNDDQTAAGTPKGDAPTTPDQNEGPVKPNAGNSAPALFDPGNTYHPPNTAVVASSASRKLTDPAACLIWVDHECEIATLDEKYLRLNGSMEAATHEWKIKDHAKLDALVQMAEIGARRGITFAAKTDIDPSVLAMIYEKAANQRTRGTDAASLDSLRNFWRCALLGNMCWQLAHTRKAEAVDLSNLTPEESGKLGKKGDKGKKGKTETAQAASEAADTNAAAATPPSTNAPGETTNTVTSVNPDGQASVKQNVTVTTPSTAPPADMAPAPDAPQPAPVQETPTPAPAMTEARADQPTTTPVVAPAPESVPATAPVPARSPVVLPAPEPAPATTVANVMPENVPVAPIAHTEDIAPATNAEAHAVPPSPSPAPASLPPASASLPVAPAPNVGDAEMNIPVAPIARAQDLAGTSDAPATTNSAPAGPIRPTRDNADGHNNAFP
jgi:hypothetical protein